MQEYGEKFNALVEKTNFDRLPTHEQLFIKEQAAVYRFSFQELKQIIDMAIDFNMWDEPGIAEYWKDFPHKKKAFHHIRDIWQTLRQTPNSYEGFSPGMQHSKPKISFVESPKEGLGLGACPVASEKTRCCNLLTLDAVESCGFDCSYCSIQSFYNQNRIGFDPDFVQKLKALDLDPGKTYHIGTGQSSDSLLWGNRGGILDALFDFAETHPNVILEFKTKSDNIAYFLENEVPANILCTWSLNTPTIIENEEHLSAPLEKRLQSARRLADKGVLVGFHFHPIVEYDNYLEEYGEVYRRLLNTFRTDEVALVSMGTLTFIKPVIKKLRERNFKSKILQMPMDDAGGKQSYPIETKREMFRHAYESFKPWHESVFFYLCMEDHSLWKETFGYQYESNACFEEAMLKAYAEKIRRKD